MREIFINIGILFLLLIIVYAIVAHYRTAWAVRKVRNTSKEKKILRLDEMLRPFGFLYDPKQDIIYSKLHPWQRELGYEKAFDEGAVLLSMVIDCEPVYFEYDGKMWLIEFWKGQYGMTTGAEIGLYAAEKPTDYKTGDEKKLHYDSVSDEEIIRMQYVLYRKEEEVFRRNAPHWWLTGFEPGLFSKPKELEMFIRLIFPTEKMCCAFYKGLVGIGYGATKSYISGKSATLYYHRPKTKQPKRKHKWLRTLAQYNNKRNCRLYQKRTKMFGTDLDKIMFISFRYPILYRALRGFTGWRKIKKNKKMRGR